MHNTGLSVRLHSLPQRQSHRPAGGGDRLVDGQAQLGSSG